MDIDKLKEMCEKATKGPWEASHRLVDGSDQWRITCRNECKYVEKTGTTWIARTPNNKGARSEETEYNAEFIALARTAVPVLIRALEIAEEHMIQAEYEINCYHGNPRANTSSNGELITMWLTEAEKGE